MEQIYDFFEKLLNSQDIILYGGFTLLLIVVFAETGLFIGFFLPGDYLLFTAGLLCGTSALNVSIYNLVACVTLAAVCGDFTGYFTGRFLGKRLFQKEDSFFFKKKYLEKTRAFYRKYGAATLILGRFLPIIRTFAPILAGAVDVELRKFTIFNVVGAVLWVWTLVPIGYFLGKTFPEIINYVGYFIIGFVIITTIPLLRSLVHFNKSRIRKKLPKKAR